VQYNTTFGNIKKAVSVLLLLKWLIKEIYATQGNKVRMYNSEQKNRYSAQTNCMSWWQTPPEQHWSRTLLFIFALNVYSTDKTGYVAELAEKLELMNWVPFGHICIIRAVIYSSIAYYTVSGWPSLNDLGLFILLRWWSDCSVNYSTVKSLHWVF
jgi:hypothetical protein